MDETRGILPRPDGVPLAHARLGGEGPTVVFLGGYASDMEGTKALHLRDRCAARGRAFLRLDYSGHGASGGAFEDGSVGTWAADAALVIEALAPGPAVLVGSSLGGWIALLLARRWGAGRVRGVVGVAAAPDFTEALLRPSLSPAEAAALSREGVVRRPSPYGPPLAFTARLLEDGRDHLLLPGPIAYGGPVRLLQGMADEEVPWRHALRLVEALPGGDVRLTLIRDGDHRLSRPSDLAALGEALDSLPA